MSNPLLAKINRLIVRAANGGVSKNDVMNVVDTCYDAVEQATPSDPADPIVVLAESTELETAEECQTPEEPKSTESSEEAS